MSVMVGRNFALPVHPAAMFPSASAEEALAQAAEDEALSDAVLARSAAAPYAAALDDVSAPAPDAASARPSRFQSIVARELWDRERRRENIRRVVPDAALLAGATCIIATMGCDPATALTRTLVILGGMKAVLYPLVVACEVHDFRAGEPCLSRRVYNWFHGPADGVAS